MVKHTPQRTCIACRKIAGKRELIRLVHTGDGTVEIDPEGKRAGRGAYLCKARECWEAGLKGGRLEHALRIALTQDNRQRLIDYKESIAPGVNSGEDR